MVYVDEEEEKITQKNKQTGWSKLTFTVIIVTSHAPQRIF